jgi:hypothetical protein
VVPQCRASCYFLKSFPEAGLLAVHFSCVLIPITYLWATTLELFSFYLQASTPRRNINQNATCDAFWCRCSNVLVHWNNIIVFLHFSWCQLTKNSLLFACGFTWELEWLISKSRNFLFKSEIQCCIYNSKSRH